MSDCGIVRIGAGGTSLHLPIWRLENLSAAIPRNGSKTAHLQEPAVPANDFILFISSESVKRRGRVYNGMIISLYVDDNEGAGEIDGTEDDFWIGARSDACEDTKHVKTRSRIQARHDCAGSGGQWANRRRHLGGSGGLEGVRGSGRGECCARGLGRWGLERLRLNVLRRLETHLARTKGIRVVLRVSCALGVRSILVLRALHGVWGKAGIVG